MDADPRSVNIPAHEPAEAEADPPQPDALHDDDTTVNATEDHPCVLALGLPALVAEALDAYADVPLRKRKGLVRHHVTANSTRRWSDEAFDTAYRAELLRRDVAATPTLNGLRRALRRDEGRLQRAEEQNDPSADWWRFTIRVLAAELRRRPPEPQRTRRRVCEALPDTRKAGERHQAELWAAVERDQAQREALPRVCPSPAPQALAPDPLAVAAPGIAGRLRALKAGKAQHAYTASVPGNR